MLTTGTILLVVILTGHCHKASWQQSKKEVRSVIQSLLSEKRKRFDFSGRRKLHV